MPQPLPLQRSPGVPRGSAQGAPGVQPSRAGRGGAGQPTLRLQATYDVRPEQRFAVQAQHISKRGWRRGLPPRSRGHRGYHRGARLVESPPGVQEEQRQAVGVHGGVAGPEASLRPLYPGPSRAPRPCPSSLGEAFRSDNTPQPSPRHRGWPPEGPPAGGE